MYINIYVRNGGVKYIKLEFLKLLSHVLYNIYRFVIGVASYGALGHGPPRFLTV